MSEWKPSPENFYQVYVKEIEKNMIKQQFF